MDKKELAYSKMLVDMTKSVVEHLNQDKPTGSSNDTEIEEKNETEVAENSYPIEMVDTDKIEFIDYNELQKPKLSVTKFLIFVAGAIILYKILRGK